MKKPIGWLHSLKFQPWNLNYGKYLEMGFEEG